MQKIAVKRTMVCIGALAWCIASPLLQAQMSVARPAADARKDGLAGMAAYAREHQGLTADQLRIGYELCGDYGRPECAEKTDRALLLKLIRRTRDSLDFAVWAGYNETPLMTAAKRGDAEVVAAIMAKGVSLYIPNSATRQIDAALEYAAFGQAASVGSYLPDFWGTPEGYEKTIKLLLDAGANPRERPPGIPPLESALRVKAPDAASKKIKLEVIQLLLEHGADPNTPSVAGALYTNEDEPVFNLLVAHGLALKKPQSTAALVQGVQYRNHALVKMALTQGADPDVGADGWQWALSQADDDTIVLLLDAGAYHKCKPKPVCATYWKRLIFAGVPNPEALRILIANGLNPDVVDEEGNTALGHALAGPPAICPASYTYQQCTDMLRSKLQQSSAAAVVLLQAGADPNKRSQGKLPLMLVQDSEHEAITLLLDKGARMESGNLGPVSMAMASKRPFLAGELLRRSHGKLGSDESWALLLAAQDGNVALVQALAQHGANLDAPAPFGETALHYAAARGDAPMIKLLLSAGANPNRQTESAAGSGTGESLNPVVIAAAYANMKLHTGKADEYRSAGLKPLEFRDQVELRYGGVTPLMLAVASGNVQAARALLDGGANATLKSASGYTALDTAQGMGNSQMVQLLTGRK